MRNFKITVDGNVYDVSVEETNQAGESKPAIVPIAKKNEIKPVPVKTETVKPAAPAVKAGGTEIIAPMPGMVLSFKVESGAEVKKGQVLLVLEAMKMENDISSPADGKVTLVASKGATVNTGDVLAVIS